MSTRMIIIVLNKVLELLLEIVGSVLGATPQVEAFMGISMQV